MVLPPSPTPTDGGDRLENMGEEELRKLARDLLRTKKVSVYLACQVSGFFCEALTCLHSQMLFQHLFPRSSEIPTRTTRLSRLES